MPLSATVSSYPSPCLFRSSHTILPLPAYFSSLSRSANSICRHISSDMRVLTSSICTEKGIFFSANISEYTSAISPVTSVRSHSSSGMASREGAFILPSQRLMRIMRSVSFITVCKLPDMSLTLESGLSSICSTFPFMTVSGVRSSCDISRRNCFSLRE